MSCGNTFETISILMLALISVVVPLCNHIEKGQNTFLSLNIFTSAVDYV